MTIITIRDFRTCGVCKEAKQNFFERYGLDWRGFVKNGIHVDELRKPGQHHDRIDMLEAAAKKRLNGG